MPNRIIENTCQDLIDADYREGFNDSVLIKVRQALESAGYNAEASELWSKVCCGYKNYITETYGEHINDLFNRAEQMSKGQGCFVMPDWGTKGS